MKISGLPAVAAVDANDLLERAYQHDSLEDFLAALSEQEMHTVQYAVGLTDLLSERSTQRTRFHRVPSYGVT
jgi:hypothetical protein